MIHYPKKNITNRLKRIEGQVRAVERMTQNGTYCIDVITQISAIKQALSKVENLLLEQHMNTCIVRQFKDGNNKKAVDEIMKVYTLKRS